MPMSEEYTQKKQFLFHNLKMHFSEPYQLMSLLEL